MKQNHTIEVRYESIFGEHCDKTWTELVQQQDQCPTQADCDALAAEHLQSQDGITGVEVVVFVHGQDQLPHDGERLDIGGFYPQKYQIIEVSDIGRRNIGAFATLAAAIDAAKLATDDGWEEHGRIGSRTPELSGYQPIRAYREDETTRYAVVMQSI